MASNMVRCAKEKKKHSLKTSKCEKVMRSNNEENFRNLQCFPMKGLKSTRTVNHHKRILCTPLIYKRMTCVAKSSRLDWMPNLIGIPQEVTGIKRKGIPRATNKKNKKKQKRKGTSSSSNDVCTVGRMNCTKVNFQEKSVTKDDYLCQTSKVTDTFASWLRTMKKTTFGIERLRKQQRRRKYTKVEMREWYRRQKGEKYELSILRNGTQKSNMGQELGSKEKQKKSLHYYRNCAEKIKVDETAQEANASTTLKMTGGKWLIYLRKEARKVNSIGELQAAWSKIQKLVNKGKLYFAECHTDVCGLELLKTYGVIVCHTPDFTDIADVEKVAKTIKIALRLKEPIFYITNNMSKSWPHLGDRRHAKYIYGPNTNLSVRKGSTWKELVKKTVLLPSESGTTNKPKQTVAKMPEEEEELETQKRNLPVDDGVPDNRLKQPSWLLRITKGHLQNAEYAKRKQIVHINSVNKGKNKVEIKHWIFSEGVERKKITQIDQILMKQAIERKNSRIPLCQGGSSEEFCGDQKEVGQLNECEPGESRNQAKNKGREKTKKRKNKKRKNGGKNC